MLPSQIDRHHITTVQNLRLGLKIVDPDKRSITTLAWIHLGSDKDASQGLA
jgi:hypothetical protein